MTNRPFLLRILLLVAFLLSVSFVQRLAAQPEHGVPQNIAPPRKPLYLPGQFPFPKMWDDAVAEAGRTGRQALILDVDYVDTNSIRFRDSVLSDPQVQRFLSDHFVLAVNDFSIDPPVTVGLDSLRNLGLRLSGLEDRYHLVIRPTALLVQPDGTEIDRIVLPQQYTPREFIGKVQDILEGRNTLASYVNAFWRDSSNLVLRLALIDHFEERSMYDSVLKHLTVLSTMTQVPKIAREAELRYSYLKLNVEGKTAPLRRLLASFSRSQEDSLQYLRSMLDLLTYYQKRKQVDSVSVFYQRIFEYTGVRDPDLLNDYAWELASYSKKWDTALVLINEALKAKPNEPNYHDTKAFVDASLHNWADAVADATKALILAPAEDKKYFQSQLDGYVAQMKEAGKPAQADPAPAPARKLTKKNSGKKS